MILVLQGMIFLSKEEQFLQLFVNFFSHPFDQDMILLQQEGFPSTIVSSAFHLNKTCDSSTIHWTTWKFLHQVSEFLQLSISNKTSFLSNKGFFYYTFSISSLAHWTKEWMDTVAWLNEYSSMKEALRHGKGESAIRFLEHKLQLCQLSSSSSSHLVGGWV